MMKIADLEPALVLVKRLRTLQSAIEEDEEAEPLTLFWGRLDLGIRTPVLHKAVEDEIAAIKMVLKDMGVEE